MGLKMEKALANPFLRPKHKTILQILMTLEEKDFVTHNFLQWYVTEQLEEEALARTVLDKINLIGNDKGGLYLFDRDIQQLTVKSAASGMAGE